MDEDSELSRNDKSGQPHGIAPYGRMTNRIAYGIVRSGGVFQDGDEVTCGAGDNKEVPNEMGIGNPFGRVKAHVCCVGDSSRRQPKESLRRHVEPQGLYGNYDKPAHGKI